MAAMFLNHNFSYGLPAVAGNQSAFNTADYHHQPQVAHHHEVKPTMMAPMAPPPSCSFGAHHHQHQLQQQMLAAPSYVGRGGYDHKPILAERFKTKMCKNYIEQGACPYVFRCMFAHGEYELRTKQMNMADGLVTEEAIKAFKRARFEAEKATYFASLSTTVVSGATGRRRNDPYASVTSWHPFATFPSPSVATAVPTTPTSSTCAAASSQFAAPSPARTMTPLPEQIASSDSDCDFASSSLYCC